MKKGIGLLGVFLGSVYGLFGCNLPTTMTVNINRTRPSVTLSPRPTVSPEVVARGWSEALDAAFDIADTFDQLQPWRGRCGGNFYGSDSAPRLLDGSESLWTSYSCWGDSSSGPSWIDNFGPGTQITGKSLIIDLGTTAKGPSRLGLYFGDGRANSGYDDLYLFYRVRFPQNQWPTQIDPATQIGTFNAGEPYASWTSWKFGAFNMGCTGVNTDLQCNGAEPYSEMHIVPNIKRYNFGTMAGKLSLVAEPTGTNAYWATGREIQTERWLGVEFHYKLAQQDGQKVVVMETWIYDEDGTAHLAQAPVVHSYAALSAPDEKFNSFFLGGNNSNSYLWGPTMESAYLVDDFIINGTRIGPTYFQLANAMLAVSGEITSPSDAIPPAVISFTLPAAVSSGTVPVSSFTATDNVGVTGYLITQSSAAPLANASGWLATPPSSFSFANSGSYTLYAWAKDAAGHVSASRSASVTVTLPDTVAPVVTAFTMPATATSLTVPVSTFTATDNVAVTGYRITESATAPLASATGWLATRPTSYTFSAAGARTAYAWARDAAGRVSLSRSAAVTITLPDTVAPVVTAFTMPATATSLTVPVSTFTATDNVAVTGYRITESATAPLASATGWLATRPTSYLFSGAGVRTAYAWARDAAGRVSASRSAAVTITLPPVADTSRKVYLDFEEFPVTTGSVPGNSANWLYSSAVTNNYGIVESRSSGWRSAATQPDGIHWFFEYNRSGNCYTHMGVDTFGYMDITASGHSGKALRDVITGGRAGSSVSGPCPNPPLGTPLYNKESYTGASQVYTGAPVGHSYIYFKRIASIGGNRITSPYTAAVNANRMSAYIHLPPGATNGLGGYKQHVRQTYQVGLFRDPASTGYHHYFNFYNQGGGWAKIQIEETTNGDNGNNGATRYISGLLKSLWQFYFTTQPYSGLAVPPYEVKIDSIAFDTDTYGPQNNETISNISILYRSTNKTFEVSFNDKYKNSAETHATAEVRYCFSPITNENWSSATPVQVIADPRFAIQARTDGRFQKASSYYQGMWAPFQLTATDTARLVPGATVYFAIKDVSQVGGTSTVPVAGINGVYGARQGGRTYDTNPALYTYAVDAAALPYIKRISYTLPAN